MKPVIGLGVRSTSVSAVRVDHRGILAHAERSRSVDAPLASVIAEVLGAVAPNGSRGLVVVAAVGPATSHVKLLAGLPAVRDRRVAARLVEENFSRFFLRRGRPFMTTVEQRRGGGAVWAAVFDHEELQEILRACGERGHRLAAVLPVAAALPHALIGPSLEWTDGGLGLVIEHEQGSLTNVRRMRAGAEPARFRVCGALEQLGEDAAPRYADAYGAASCQRAELAWRPPPPAAAALRARRYRISVLSVILLLLAATALALPVLRARTASEAAAQELRQLAAQRSAAIREQEQFRAVSTAIDRIDRFRTTRRSMIQLLSAITSALPESTAMLSLRIDSLGGSFTAIAPSVTELVPALTVVPEILSPRIVGAVSRDVVAGAQLERATIQFMLPGAFRPRPPMAGTP